MRRVVSQRKFAYGCDGFSLVLAAFLGGSAIAGAVAFGLVAARRKHVLVSEILRVCTHAARKTKMKTWFMRHMLSSPFFASRMNSGGALGLAGSVLRLDYMMFYGFLDGNQSKS